MTAGRLLLAAILLLAAAAARAGASGSPAFCDRAHALTARQQDHLLRFAAVAREELAALGSDTALISRSGIDLSRFHIRYSHAAIAWQDGDRAGWTTRQLYYACDEARPRIFDQGLAGFAMGIDDPALAYLSIVRLPDDAGRALRAALLDTPRVLHLLADRYSANAYPYSTRYQNCNQWLMEVLALAWGDVADGEQLRERAQQWLRLAGYAPEPVDVDSRWLMVGAHFVPLLHLNDHPPEDRAAMKLKVSLPSTIEAFVRARLPASERVELCQDGRQIVVHRGWTPIADGCRPGEGDRVVPFD